MNHLIAGLLPAVQPAPSAAPSAPSAMSSEASEVQGGPAVQSPSDNVNAQQQQPTPTALPPLNDHEPRRDSPFNPPEPIRESSTEETAAQRSSLTGRRPPPLPPPLPPRSRSPRVKPAPRSPLPTRTTRSQTGTSKPRRSLAISDSDSDSDSDEGDRRPSRRRARKGADDDDADVDAVGSAEDGEGDDDNDEDSSSTSARKPAASSSVARKKPDWATGTKSRWTAEEDAKLLEVVQASAVLSWDEIALKMPGRKPSGCAMRWYNFVRKTADPNTRHAAVATMDGAEGGSSGGDAASKKKKTPVKSKGKGKGKEKAIDDDHDQSSALQGSPSSSSTTSHVAPASSAFAHAERSFPPFGPRHDVSAPAADGSHPPIAPAARTIYTPRSSLAGLIAANADRLESSGTPGAGAYNGGMPDGMPHPVTNIRGRRTNSPGQLEGTLFTPQGRPQKIHPCPASDCSAAFRRSEHLKRHFKSVHMGAKPFACEDPTCPKSFSRRDNLQQHMKMVHDKQLPLETKSDDNTYPTVLQPVPPASTSASSSVAGPPRGSAVNGQAASNPALQQSSPVPPRNGVSNGNYRLPREGPNTGGPSVSAAHVLPPVSSTPQTFALPPLPAVSAHTLPDPIPPFQQLQRSPPQVPQPLYEPPHTPAASASEPIPFATGSPKAANAHPSVAPGSAQSQPPMALDLDVDQMLEWAIAPELLPADQLAAGQKRKVADGAGGPGDQLPAKKARVGSNPGEIAV